MSDSVTPAERWLPVVGYEGAYEVSDQGRVRSVDRVRRHPRGDCLLRGRLLTPSVDSTKHLTVSLHVDGVHYTRKVHRLVAQAFIGPRPDGEEVLHGPGGILDNRLVNLSYGTRRQNLLDRRRDGTDPQLNKTHCSREHMLIAPNLSNAHLASGKRACLACKRGHATVRNARLRGVTLDVQTEADRHYAALAIAVT